jgi:hypothetical protein
VLADAQSALNSASDEVAKAEAQIAIEVNFSFYSYPIFHFSEDLLYTVLYKANFFVLLNNRERDFHVLFFCLPRSYFYLLTCQQERITKST